MPEFCAAQLCSSLPKSYTRYLNTTTKLSKLGFFPFKWNSAEGKLELRKTMLFTICEVTSFLFSICFVLNYGPKIRSLEIHQQYLYLIQLYFMGPVRNVSSERICIARLHNALLKLYFGEWIAWWWNCVYVAITILLLARYLSVI